MAPDAKHHVVMIVQEAVSNAIQYGEASSLSFDMRFDADAFRLIISDDGRGFPQPVENKDPARGYGVGNMRYRSKCLEATLTMTSALGSGTSVTLVVPRLGPVTGL